MFATKVNATVEVDEEGRVGVKRSVFLRVAAAVHCVMVIMQVLERAWPWSSKRLESIPDFNTRMAESGYGDLLLLSPGAIESVRRAGVRRVVSGTR